MVVIITGCNTGIGKETARNLHLEGYEIIFACRSKEKAEEAIADIAKINGSKASPDKLKFMSPLDTSSLPSVKKFCEDFLDKYKNEKLETLICNAGTGYVKRDDRITKEGFEAVFQINYLSHFLMVALLGQKLKEGGGRVVTLTSVEHRSANAVCKWDELAKKSTTIRSYPSSKLALTFLAYELQRRTSIKSAAVNPGFVSSDIWRYLKGMKATFQRMLNSTVCLSVQKGCQTSVWAATTKDLPSGPVYVSPYRVYDCCAFAWDAVNIYAGPTICHSSKLSYDTKEASKLWEFSIQAVQPYLPSKLPEGFQ